MYVVFVVVAAVVVFAVVAVTLGRGDLMDDEPPAAAGADLPETPLSTDDLRELRFPVVLRGYRMDRVDAVIDRLVEELDRRDRHIAQFEEILRQVATGPPQRPRQSPR